MKAIRQLAAFCAVAPLATLPILADGNTTLFRQQAGPFVITVFAEGGALHAGPVDLNVMVQRVSDEANVQDAKVNVRLKRSAADKIEEVVAPATHANSPNKLLYGAHITIPSQGEWIIGIDASGKDGFGSAEAKLNILPQQSATSAYWPYFVMVPVVIGLFILNRRLKRKWGITRTSSQPTAKKQP